MLIARECTIVMRWVRFPAELVEVICYSGRSFHHLRSHSGTTSSHKHPTSRKLDVGYFQIAVLTQSASSVDGIVFLKARVFEIRNGDPSRPENRPRWLSLRHNFSSGSRGSSWGGDPVYLITTQLRAGRQLHRLSIQDYVQYP